MGVLAEERADVSFAEGAVVPESWKVSCKPRSSGAMQEWSAVLAETHYSHVDVRSTDNTPSVFHGTVTRWTLGDLMLVDCDCVPWHGHKEFNDGHITAGSAIGLQLVRRGSISRTVHGHHTVARPGDVGLWASWQTADVEVLDRFAKRTLIIPLDRMVAASPRLATGNVLPNLQNARATHLLVRYIDLIATELPSLDAAAAAAAADAALELLRSAVEPGIPTSRAAKRQAMRIEIRRYVRSHLQDPLLDPSSVASAHAMSVRVLHALFEDSGESVAGLIRRERLARCWDDLERLTGGAVTEIAFRWGFKDSAHFSRLFKREFGISPSEVRRNALQAQA
jgi:AraC family transcriptional regulator, positive regulator of tynA and feaB